MRLQQENQDKEEKNKNFTEIQLAQAMIEGAKNVKGEDEHRAKAIAIEKKLQKRKSSVITNFFEKKNQKLTKFMNPTHIGKD